LVTNYPLAGNGFLGVAFVVCYIDQLGEEPYLSVSLLSGESLEIFITQHLQTFVVSITEQEKVEW